MSLVYLPAYCQVNEIMNLALSDPSNFKVMTTFGEKLPKKFLVLQMTAKWNTETFVMDGVDLDDRRVKMQMDSGTYRKYNERFARTYYDPYKQTYLFKDSLLGAKIGRPERARLRELALHQKIKRLDLAGPNYSTVSGYPMVSKGFFMTVTEPVFTADKDFAFICFCIVTAQVVKADVYGLLAYLEHRNQGAPGKLGRR